MRNYDLKMANALYAVSGAYHDILTKAQCGESACRGSWNR